MTTPKILVMFYSTDGTNHGMAQVAKEAATAAGADVRLRRVKETAPQDVIDGQDAWKAQVERASDIPELTHDDFEWADGYFVSVPTRFGGAPSQFRAFVDTLGPLWQKGAMVSKTFTATTSAQTSHGGQETTLQTLYISASHWGCILVPPGYSDPLKFEDGGNPYGYSAKAGEVDETGRKSIAHQARRLVEITAKLTA